MRRLFLLLLIPLVAHADADQDVAAGNLALQNNKPEEALAHYQKAEATLSGNADLSFNKGGALFAQKKFEEAATELLSATSSKESVKRAEAYRHYGDALFRQEKIDGAIQAYIQALTLDPNDDVAKHNLEVALGKQQPQSQESQDPQSQPQSQQSESQPSSQQNQQEQQNQDGQEKTDEQNQEKNQKQQNGQENQEKKDDQKEQGAQNQEKQEQQKQEQQQAQQAQQNQEQPKEPEDKLLDALRAKEKSFLHAKKKGKGNTPNVMKDW